MIPTHATKAGIRYRYYISLPHLNGESKTASVGSVSRIPAADLEDIIIKSVNEHLITQHDNPTSSGTQADNRGAIAEQVVRIDVHKGRLAVRFKSAGAEEASDSTDGQLLSIPWQKPPRRILKSYADYYNPVRTHRSLHKDAPISRPIHQTGFIRSHPILGGLHHHYVRV